MVAVPIRCDQWGRRDLEVLLGLGVIWIHREAVGQKRNCGMGSEGRLPLSLVLL